MHGGNPCMVIQFQRTQSRKWVNNTTTTLPSSKDKDAIRSPPPTPTLGQALDEIKSIYRLASTTTATSLSSKTRMPPTPLAICCA